MINHRMTKMIYAVVMYMERGKNLSNPLGIEPHFQGSELFFFQRSPGLRCDRIDEGK